MVMVCIKNVLRPSCYCQLFEGELDGSCEVVLGVAAFVHVQAEKKNDHSIAVLVPAGPHYYFDKDFYSTLFLMVHHQLDAFRVVALKYPFDNG